MKAQKYVIYINGNPLIIGKSLEMGDLNPKKTFSSLIFPYQGRKKGLSNFIDMLEKAKEPTWVLLETDDVEAAWQDFQAKYRLIEAAGGYVTNSKGELLSMFRLNTWDLPKGKIDPGETPEVAAMRELCEETGVCNATLGSFLCKTYHTYPHKGNRVLKTTHWFRISAPDDVPLVPQAEEGIERLEWKNPVDLLDMPNFYDSLRQVVQFGVDGEGV